MDFEALKKDIIRVFKDNPNILTTDYESLADKVVEPMQKQYDKDSKDWEKTRKQLEEQIEQLKEKEAVVPTLE